MTEFSKKYNEVISALISDGIITEEKVHYAERVLSKLKGEYKLLDVLKKLKYITDDDVWGAVQKKRVSTRLGNLLVELGYISISQLESAIEMQKKERESKAAGNLVGGFDNLSDVEFAKSKAIELGYHYIEPVFESIPSELLTKCRPEWYETHRFFPVSDENGIVSVGFADPSDADSVDAAREFFGEDLNPVVIRADLIPVFVSRYRSFLQAGTLYTGPGSVGKGVFQAIVSAAIEKEADFIYIEPMHDRLMVRFRSSFVTYRHQDFPPQIKASLFNYIRESCLDESEATGRKIYTEMNTEKGLFLISGSTAHTRYGDSATLNIRKIDSEPPGFYEIPMTRHSLAFINDEAVRKNHGLFIIAGQDSSAKKATLYSVLNQKKKNLPEYRISILEKKPSFIMEDMLYFNAGDSSIDIKINGIAELYPDMIAVSELDDRNACRPLLDAASKGIQTAAVMRCSSITDALEPFIDSGCGNMLASHLSGVILQKVMKRICPVCVTPIELQTEILKKAGINPVDLAGLNPMKGVGCKACGGTGYQGLFIATETMIPDDRIREAISSAGSSYMLKKIISSSPGFVNLLEDAIIWAGDGQTTIEEIVRVFPRNQRTRTFAELQKTRGV